MSPQVKTRVATGLLLGLMVLAWFTMEADKVRTIVLIVLALFLFRIVMHAARSRYDE